MRSNVMRYLRKTLMRSFQEWPEGQPPLSPRTPPEQRSPWGTPESAPGSNAPTERIGGASPGQPYGFMAPYGSSMPPNPNRRGAFWASAILGGIVLLLLAVLAFVELGRAVLPSGASQTPPRNPTATIAQPTATEAIQVFQTNHSYVYSDIIGHSKTTALTNSDINVTLQTLSLSSATGETTAVVAFQNLDSAKQGDFLFVQRTNVYLVDNQGARYQAIQANPSEVIVPAGQTVTVMIAFPLITSGATTLDFYFNTDHDALETTCAKLFPSLLAQTC